MGNSSLNGIDRAVVMAPNDAPRPVFLLTTIQPGLFFRSRLPILRAMRNLGWSVHVALPEAEEWKHLESEDIGIHEIRVHRGGTDPLKERETLKDFKRIARLVKPELAHHFSSKAVIYGSLSTKCIQLSTLTGIGFSLSGAGGQVERLSTRIAAPILYKLALKRNAKVIFQNEEDRSEFLKRKLVNAGRTRVLPGSGVDMTEFHPDKRVVANNVVRVVMLSRIIKPKGVLEFLGAAEILQRDLPGKVQFVLAGPLDKQNPDALSRENLESLCAQSGAVWVGEVPSAIDAYADAHIAVLPSYHEGLPRALVEAAAMGLPIVTTQARGCRDTLIDGVTGHMVPVRDTLQLASKIKDLALNEADRKRMGAKGREFVADRYSVQRTLESVLGIYKEVLEANGHSLDHRGLETSSPVSLQSTAK